MYFIFQSNHNNDAIKTLTASAAIFLPLNLITGFLGMNFEHFTFLKNKKGLLVSDIFMGRLVVVLGVYFWVTSFIIK